VEIVATTMPLAHTRKYHNDVYEHGDSHTDEHIYQHRAGTAFFDAFGDCMHIVDDVVCFIAMYMVLVLLPRQFRTGPHGEHVVVTRGEEDHAYETK
jgi:hypothetical protein